ncbi:MAG: hypothetical protein IJ324_06810 [Lachnospiraceae bacterium]|nr:hypothetical protein [Lachnospiraceae bacterium]
MILDKKKNTAGTVVFLAGILLVFAVFDFVKQDIGRDKLLQITTYMDFFLNVKVVNGVYLAEDDYYIEQHLPQTYPASLHEEKLLQITELVQDYPQTQVILIPTADNILTDYLPWQAPYLNERNLLTAVEDAIGDDHVIDVFPAFVEHVQEGVYFKTDSRITSVGAYYIYREWAKTCASFPFWYQLDKLETVKSNFVGDMVATIGVKSDVKDQIKVFPHVLTQQVSINYDNEMTADSYVSENRLTSEDAYDYFLDGDYGVTIIDTEFKNGKALFVLKDDNANVVIPLLAPHYEKIYAVDLQHFTGDLKEYMKDCDIYDQFDVLVMYGCDSFLEEFMY